MLARSGALTATIPGHCQALILEMEASIADADIAFDFVSRDSRE